MVNDMAKKRNGIFDWIAPIYGLFFNIQAKHYKMALDGALFELNLTGYKSIIDVGCGTGALCSVLKQMGLKVTGVDRAERMLRIAARHPENIEVSFLQASVLERMPFEDKEFDISIAALVAHGLKQDERKRMYAEMGRITEHMVLIYDYNKKRSMLVDIVEWFEGGDYFNFIKNPQIEMQECFEKVFVIDVSKYGACYICSPHKGLFYSK